MADWEVNADSDDSGENDELDAAYKDLIMLEQSGIIPFEDFVDIIAYVDKSLRKRSHELIWRKGSEVRHYVLLHQICAKREDGAGIKAETR